MAFTSESSRALWESRWERMWELGEFEKLGPKGEAYIAEKYGEEIESEEPRRRRGREPEEEEYYDDYENPYDFEIEY